MAGYKSNINKFSNKNPRQKIQDLKDPTYGIYMAEVISTKDTSRTGRLQVFVPALAQDKQTKTGYFDAIWSSPFAGSTDPKAVGKEIDNPEQSMKSYGMWMVPPDIGNFVLVAFGDGNMKYPVIISCLFQDRFNYMVPGLPGGKNYQIPGSQLPTVEKNKRSAQVTHNDAVRPIQHSLSEAIVKQGLIDDPIRGTSTSGARRESPSEVFGILTPGPRDPANFDNRLGGHQFVMDDNINHRQIRIRSAQGNQILLDDNEGMIYFINKSGKVWMEFSDNGAVQLYGEAGIHLRTKGDFNIRADKNVNIEAGNDVNIKAAGDTNANGYAGAGTLGQAPTGIGGNLNFESQFETRIASSASFYATSASGDIQLNAAGVANTQAGGDINLKTGGNFNATTPSKASIKSGSDTVIQAGSNIVEKSGNNILMNSGGASATEASEAATVGSIQTQSFTDQPPGEIEYDRTKDNPIPTGGVRTGTAPIVATIVNDYVTAEPWEGHGVSSAENEDLPGTQASGTSVADGVSPSGNAIDNSPADVNSPQGYQAGTGYTDANTPVYSNPVSVPGNFGDPLTKELNKTLASANAVKAMGRSVNPARVPVLAKGSEEYVRVGSTRILDAGEASTKLLAATANGRKAKTNAPQLSKLSNVVQTLKSTQIPADQVNDYLAQEGIAMFTEGNAIVFMDKQGNIIRDISNGSISDATNQALIEQDFLAASDSIKPLLAGTVLSDNQLAALTSFSMSIGLNNFQGSLALRSVLNGNLQDVPRDMLQFSYDAAGNIKPDVKNRRIWEGELFQTPDYVPLPDYGYTNVSWLQQARDIRNIRKQVIR